MCIACPFDSFSAQAISIINGCRKKRLEDERLVANSRYVKYVREIQLRDFVSRIGRLSIGYFNLWRNGKNKIGELNHLELRGIRRFIDHSVYGCLERCLGIKLQVDLREENIIELPFEGRLVDVTM